MRVPFAPCRDLPTMARIYPEDKRLTVHVSAADFSLPVAAGDEVVIVGGTDRHGQPLDGTPKVRGRVKRTVIEVEIDLATLEEPEHAGQGTLGEAA